MNTYSLATIDLFAATPAFTLSELRASNACATGYNKLLQGLTRDCKLHIESISTMRDLRIPLLYVLQNNGIRDAIWCMRIDWHEHKQLYMQFVAGCADAADVYAADAAEADDVYAAYAAYDDAAAAYVAYVAAADADAAAADAADVAAADAAEAATDAASCAASCAAAAARADAYADAYAAERKRQHEHLAELLTETKTKQIERKLP